MKLLSIFIVLLASMSVWADTKDDRVKELEAENRLLKEEVRQLRADLKRLQEQKEAENPAAKEPNATDAGKPRAMHTTYSSLLARLPKEKQPPVDADTWNDILLAAAQKWTTENVTGDRIRFKLKCAGIFKGPSDTRVQFYSNEKPQKQGNLQLSLQYANAIFSHEEGEKLAQKVVVGKDYIVEGTVKKVVLNRLSVGDPKGIKTGITLELSDVKLK